MGQASDKKCTSAKALSSTTSLESDVGSDPVVGANNKCERSRIDNETQSPQIFDEALKEVAFRQPKACVVHARLRGFEINFNLDR